MNIYLLRVENPLGIRNSSCVLGHVVWFCQERTGGKIIYRHFGTVYLFRGRNYNYETRPRFPLMWWRPVSPVYPKLIKRVPKGLTLDEATEMRQKGRVLMPIRKLGRLFWRFIIIYRLLFFLQTNMSLSFYCCSKKWCILGSCD